MPKKVARIKSVFSIEGRGTVIVLPSEEEWHIGPKEAIHRYERIQIRTPGGESVATFINDIEAISFRDAAVWHSVCRIRSGRKIFRREASCGWNGMASSR